MHRLAGLHLRMATPTFNSEDLIAGNHERCTCRSMYIVETTCCMCTLYSSNRPARLFSG